MKQALEEVNDGKVAWRGVWALSCRSVAYEMGPAGEVEWQ